MHGQKAERMSILYLGPYQSLLAQVLRQMHLSLVKSILLSKIRNNQAVPFVVSNLLKYSLAAEGLQ